METAAVAATTFLTGHLKWKQGKKERRGIVGKKNAKIGRKNVNTIINLELYKKNNDRYFTL